MGKFKSLFIVLACLSGLSAKAEVQGSLQSLSIQPPQRFDNLDTYTTNESVSCATAELHAQGFNSEFQPFDSDPSCKVEISVSGSTASMQLSYGTKIASYNIPRTSVTIAGDSAWAFIAGRYIQFRRVGGSRHCMDREKYLELTIIQLKVNRGIPLTSDEQFRYPILVELFNLWFGAVCPN